MGRERNPRNSESVLFKGLTRLLSGPISSYRRQNPRQLKRHQLDKYKFRSASGQPFKKINDNSMLRSTFLNGRANINRAERYIDFDQMEFSPLISSALDLCADEMITSSPLTPMLSIICPNEEIKSILNNLYYNVLNIDFNLFGWARTMLKYGDHFVYLDVDEKVGVKAFIGLPQNEVEIIESEDKTNPQYIQYQWNSAGMTLESWQVAHFRILGNDKFAPYGQSYLDGARRVWRQHQLLEDAMMAYRIVRSPERRVIKVDVGGIPEAEVPAYIEKMITDMKRDTIIDPDSGRVDLRYNPLSVENDYVIPVIGGEGGTSIDTLPGGTYTGDIDDVKYLREQLLSALKIPYSYLVPGEGTEDKTTLAQKDVSFARTIQRLQKSLTSELEKAGIVHLYTLGFRSKDLISFKVALNNPSKIAELQELEHWKTKFEVAGAATEGYLSQRTIAKKILGLSDEEFLRNKREMHYDAIFASEIEKAKQGDQALSDALDGGDGGGDGGGLDLGGDTGSGDQEDETLLAAPGKRHAPYTTPGAKGKLYTPETNDKRPTGARSRNMKSLYSGESGSNTMRNVFKGMIDLKGLASGIQEGKQTTIYDQEQDEFLEEESIINDSVEARRIIALLENKKVNKSNE